MSDETPPGLPYPGAPNSPTPTAPSTATPINPTGAVPAGGALSEGPLNGRALDANGAAGGGGSESLGPWDARLLRALTVADAAKRWATVLRYLAFAAPASVALGMILRDVAQRREQDPGASAVLVPLGWAEWSLLLLQLAVPIGIGVVVYAFAAMIELLGGRLDLLAWDAVEHDDESADPTA